MVYLAVLMNIYAWIRVDFETRIGYTRISKIKLYYHVSVKFMCTILLLSLLIAIDVTQLFRSL